MDGEIAFDWSGFIAQALGIAFEASRLVCIQKLLTGLKTAARRAENWSASPGGKQQDLRDSSHPRTKWR
jgi:hypothetical protein